MVRSVLISYTDSACHIHSESGDRQALGRPSDVWGSWHCVISSSEELCYHTEVFSSHVAGRIQTRKRIIFHSTPFNIILILKVVSYRCWMLEKQYFHLLCQKYLKNVHQSYRYLYSFYFTVFSIPEYNLINCTLKSKGTFKSFLLHYYGVRWFMIQYFISACVVKLTACYHVKLNTFAQKLCN